VRRRELLQSVFGAATAILLDQNCAGAALSARGDARPRVMTVRGWVDAGELGVTLAHEHVLANFQTYQEWASHPLAYDRGTVMAVVLPRLRSLRALGCRTFVDATAVGLGRDPVLLRVLSERSGLNILTVTGNYAAFNNTHLPPWVFTDSDDALARRWTEEFAHGIDGSGVRPGFIKLGFNGGPLSGVERKLIRAGAIAHRETGLTIGAHTGPAASAFEQMAVLDQEGVHLSAWIWIHAQNEKDISRHIEAARRGAWVEFDGIDRDTIDLHAALVTRMRDEGLLDQVLISQDAGWYNVGQDGGGAARSYETLFTHFLPALRSRGFTAGEIDTLIVRNPAKAFAVAVRTA
jgi:predicted metal-dependent phosphotriesterase family hydrolase